jgi:ferredoxin
MHEQKCVGPTITQAQCLNVDPSMLPDRHHERSGDGCHEAETVLSCTCVLEAMTEYTVEFVEHDEEITVSDKETILSRCIEEGIAQEYSCRVGMCLACSAEILEGEVTQPAARGLTDAEKESYALTCMARPQSDLKLDRGKYPPSIEADYPTAEEGDSNPEAAADD